MDTEKKREKEAFIKAFDASEKRFNRTEPEEFTWKDIISLSVCVFLLSLACLLSREKKKTKKRGVALIKKDKDKLRK